MDEEKQVQDFPFQTMCQTESDGPSPKTENVLFISLWLQ